ncbi:MAG: TolB family protein [Pyrinomonadaceae bacterium]
MGGSFRRRRGGLRAGALLVAALLATAPACRSIKETAGLSVVPKSLRDVPAERLAFRFEPDVAEEKLPEYLRRDEPDEPAAAIRTAFETQRPSDALIRTVIDPAGMRALALYGTSETDTDFRIDLYNTTGQFIRNVLPPDLTGVFPEEVAWSPDGSSILFSGVRTPAPQATPNPLDAAPALPGLAPSPPAVGVTPDAQPAPTAAPLIPSTQTFRTEQVYVGDRDGYNLRPLTAREGLIYFKLAWSPDGQQVAALACKEDEWEAQRREGNPHAGRPRLLTLEGQERLLDDRATAVEPAWSPDGSKLATAFEYDVAVYDAGGRAPTGAGLSLREPLRAASAEYDARVFKKAEPAARSKPQEPPPPPGEAVLISLNPFVRLEWVEPETVYAQTAFVHIYHDEPVFKYPRWHVLHVSPQAAVLSRLRPPRAERSAPL